MKAVSVLACEEGKATKNNLMGQDSIHSLKAEKYGKLVKISKTISSNNIKSKQFEQEENPESESNQI